MDSSLLWPSLMLHIVSQRTESLSFTSSDWCSRTLNPSSLLNCPINILSIPVLTSNLGFQRATPGAPDRFLPQRWWWGGEGNNTLLWIMSCKLSTGSSWLPHVTLWARPRVCPALLPDWRLQRADEKENQGDSVERRDRRIRCEDERQRFFNSLANVWFWGPN